MKRNYTTEELAAIGESLLPRPISEADPAKLEQNYLTELHPRRFHYIYWYPGTKMWRTSIFASSEKITHFYDLDALPKFEP